MKFTEKTYCALGIVSAALNILGGAALVFGVRAILLFNLATAAAGTMMLLLALSARDNAGMRTCLLTGALLTAFGYAPGLVGIVCGAASWPVFAWPFFRATGADSELHRAAFLVFLCGGVLLVGSFLPIPQMLGACIIIAAAAVQGVFALLLYLRQDRV